MSESADDGGFEKLDVYRRGEDLIRPIYDLVARFPDYERYGIVDQMRRACRGIPSAIAEGYGRRSSPKEFCRYLGFAVGEANEMQAHLRAARLLDYVTPEETAAFIGEYKIIGKQTTRLIQYWRKRDEF
jgi:four helix bundle protein